MRKAGRADGEEHRALHYDILWYVARAMRQVKGEQVRRELLPEQSDGAPARAAPAHARGAPQRGRAAQAQAGQPPRGPAAPGAGRRARRATPRPVVVDAGSGNAYLGFILYELFFKDRATRASCCPSRAAPELDGAGPERAARLGFARMQLRRRRTLERRAYPERIHLLTALHACDTATDDALAGAPSQHGADHVAVVPCCQAEVAAQLKESAAPGRARAGAAVRAPVAPARVRLAPDQRHPRAGARGVRLPGDGHRARPAGSTRSRTS